MSTAWRVWYWLVWAVLRAYACTRPKRVIRLAGDVYMVRWFLTSRPDGDQTGTPGYYLHHLRRADADRRLHNHPWMWANSIVLRGGYVEIRRAEGHAAHCKRYRPGDRVGLAPHIFHRIATVKPNTWTLFNAGPKHGAGWGFK